MRNLLIFAILIHISLSGCISNQKSEHLENDQKNTNMMSSIKYLALGDSYTIGESVSENMRWPVQLAERLRLDSIIIGDPVIIAKTGWTTDELMKGIVDSDIQDSFDLVTLLIGVNNQYRGRSADEFRSDFIELLNIAKDFGQNNVSRIIVLSIPDWGVMPFARGRDLVKIAREIDQYNAIVMEESQKAGITYFDITGISRMASADSSLIAEDGLHPSGKMYTLWVNEIYNTVLGRLQY